MITPALLCGRNSSTFSYAKYITNASFSLYFFTARRVASIDAFSKRKPVAVRTTPAASFAQRRRARSRRLRRRSAPVSQTKRSERLYIRLTTGEAAYLAQLADRRGLKISEYARKAIFRAVAYCDTDSLFIVSAEHEGLVPCTNGPYKLPDGRRAVRALSWAQVDDILRDLAALNVYDLDGSSFKIRPRTSTTAATAARSGSTARARNRTASS